MIKIIYNLENLPIEIIDESGKHQFAEYDNEGRLLVSRDGAGNEVKHFYDESQKTFASSSLPVKIGFPTYSQKLFYDKMQRLKTITELVDENTNYSVNYEYDALGNVIKQIDPQGSVTLFEYDAFSRLKSRCFGCCD